MKCKECDRDLEISGNLYVECSNCEALNHIKRRKKNGKIKKIRIAHSSLKKLLKIS